MYLKYKSLKYKSLKYNYFYSLKQKEENKRRQLEASQKIKEENEEKEKIRMEKNIIRLGVSTPIYVS